ncbi:MAG: hypothetical protein R3B72_51125 [Polyangiaceae bacterium]
MSLKDKVLEEGLKLASHPAVAPVLQDERLMKMFMTALSVPGRVSEITEEQRQNFVKLMALATEQEVADLRRTVRALEDDISRLRRELDELKSSS